MHTAEKIVEGGPVHQRLAERGVRLTSEQIATRNRLSRSAEAFSDVSDPMRVVEQAVEYADEMGSAFDLTLIREAKPSFSRGWHAAMELRTIADDFDLLGRVRFFEGGKPRTWMNIKNIMGGRGRCRGPTDPAAFWA